MFHSKWALAALVCILAGASAQVIVGSKPPLPATFRDGLITVTKEKGETVDKLLKAFGPTVTEQLLAGRTVELPGIAVIRIVRVKQHTDLVGGIVTTVLAKNYVEIVPATELQKVANDPGTVPAREVEPYEFKVMPDAAPGIRTDGIKVPRTRIGR